MLNIPEDIRSLTAFKRDTATALEQLRTTGRPLVLTVNGKAELVVQDAVSYQKLLELADRMEAILAVERGLREVEDGRTKPFKDVIKNLGRKNGPRGQDRQSS
ncbi:MAG TPA: type II toxin-antitoxin system Phd/YefM family antitoxin [Planctomycetota bacterium]|nr:type II toxin-antitoxin system Phd/YefM family antitoxin [Planctomycetota bacterium]